MNHRIVQTTKLSAIAFAGFMLILPALLAPRVFSDTDAPPRIGTNPNQNLILFRRGPLDPDARPDLDTSGEDRQAMSVMGVSPSKPIRVVQFAGPIRREWIDALLATGVEIIGYVPNNAYLVRGDRHALGRLAALNAGNDW